MNKKFFLCAAMLPLLAGCGALVGSTGQDTSFERQGTLNCEGTDIQTQSLVQGTANDPVRCGPQAQAIPR